MPDPVIPGGDTTTAEAIRRALTEEAIPDEWRTDALAELDVLVAALSQTERERDGYRAALETITDLRAFTVYEEDDGGESVECFEAERVLRIASEGLASRPSAEEATDE